MQPPPAEPPDPSDSDDDWAILPAEAGGPTDVVAPRVRKMRAYEPAAHQAERNRLAREVREGRWDHHFESLRR